MTTNDKPTRLRRGPRPAQAAGKYREYTFDHWRRLAQNRSAMEAARLERPPNKRKRICGDASARITPTKNDGISISRDHDGASGASSTLPPEVWAMAMNYLDYDSVLSCAATSKALLRDAMPLVTSIHIDVSRQLNAALASRFRDVREVHIYSLVVHDDEGDDEEDSDNEEEGPRLTLNYDTVIGTVPFVSRFSKLERIFFGGRLLDGEVFGLANGSVSAYSNGGTFLDIISGAYKTQLFPANLQVLGLRCPTANGDDIGGSSDCEFCKRACNTWPLQAVLCFNNEGTSRHYGEPLCRRTYSLDVCLSNDQIQDIIEARSDLAPGARFLALLGQGKRCEINPGSTTTMRVVQFNDDQLDELARFKESSNLNVSMLSQADVSRAIRRSFHVNQSDRNLPTERCYLGMKSFRYLKDEVNLPICEKDLIAPLTAKHEQNIPYIIELLKSGNDSMTKECMSLLSELFSEDYASPIHIQCAIDAGIVPLLVDCFRIGSGTPIDVQADAAYLLGMIAQVGDNTAQVLIEKGALPNLVRAAGECADTTELLSAEALLSLGRIANTSSTHRKAVLEAGVVAPLLKQYNYWKEDLDMMGDISWIICKLCHFPGLEVCSSVAEPLLELTRKLLLEHNGEKVLGNASKSLFLCYGSTERIKTMIEAGVYARLVELLDHGSKTVQVEALGALRYFMGNGSLTNDLLCVNNAVSIMSFLSSTDEYVQMNACEIVYDVLKSDNERVKKNLVTKHGGIRAFLKMVWSSDAAKIEVGLAGLSRILHFARTQSCQLAKKTVNEDIQIVENAVLRVEEEMKYHQGSWDSLEGFVKDCRTALNRFQSLV